MHKVTSRSQNIFSVDKKAMYSKKVNEDLENKKASATDRQIQFVDLKKVSPYLARNQKVELAKKVIEL
jgi:hypothetical protein